MPEMPDADLYIALGNLIARGVVAHDHQGYYPVVHGVPFRSMGLDWDHILSLAIMPGRNLH